MGSVRSYVWNGRRTWFIDYIAGDGSRVRQAIGGGEDARRLAQRVLTQREAEAQLGIHRLPAMRTPTLGAFAADWLDRNRVRLRPKTIELYDDLLTHHLLPAFGARHLGAITARDVEAYLASKSQERRRARARTPEGRVLRDKRGRAVWIDVPYAAKTINHTLTLLKTILEDARRLRHLSENPAEHVKPVASRHVDEVRFLEPAEIARLLDAAEEPWRTLYLLAVHTGLRRGELCALRWRDVDLEARRLFVRRQRQRIRDGDRYILDERPPKTRAGRRAIEDLAPSVCQALRDLPRGDDPAVDYLFLSRAGGPLDPDNIDRALGRHVQLAGLPEFSLHALRHTHASLCIAAGMNPKELQVRMGHSSITVTMDRYGHLFQTAYQGTGERLDALLKANWRQRDPDNAKRGSGKSPKPASIKGF